MTKQRFVIIGGVAAGMSAASKIRSLLPEAEIRVFEKSSKVSYIACGMPYLIAGVVQSDRSLVAYEADYFREKRRIEVFLKHEATRIDPSAKEVTVRDLSSGTETVYPYDRLLIATGARPVWPPIKGIDLPGIFPLRTLDQGLALQDYLERRRPRRALIIGAGSIGMEMAEAFRARGLEVTIVEKTPSILGSMDADINARVEEELRDHEVRLIKSLGVVEFQGEQGRVSRAVLEDGQKIEADIVLVSTGIRPNSEIAREAGIELGTAGAIRVNPKMETNLPDIWAAGDCAEAYHRILQRNVYMPLGTTANKQGRTAGNNMAGSGAEFAGITGTAVFKVFDLEVGRTGLSRKDAEREGLAVISHTIEQSSRAHYFPGAGPIRVSLVAEAGSGRLLGGQMAGREGVAKRVDVVATALAAGMTVGDMENLDLGYAPPFAPVYDPVLIAATELRKQMESV